MGWHAEHAAKLIEQALAEDLGAGDVTVAANAMGPAHIVAKQYLVCAGLPLAERVFRRLDPQMATPLRR
jgi:nicotinate-nucleotide pyrophosphorylase (carboxylating)